MNDCRVGSTSIFYLDRSGKALGAALKTEPFAIRWVTWSWTFSFPSVQPPSYSQVLPWSPVEHHIHRHLLNPAIAQRMPTTLILLINNSPILWAVAKVHLLTLSLKRPWNMFIPPLISLQNWYLALPYYSDRSVTSNIGVTPPPMLKCIQILSSKQGTSLNSMPVLNS